MNKKTFYKMLIFSLVFLFNPSYNMIDILPDFISWFILAKLFERPSDCAPYFDEARSGFIKLAYLNLSKILGLAVIIIVKGRDMSDNNILALVSFCYAVVELIFLIPTVKNVFLALFHLGQRTDAAALITNINFGNPKRGKNGVDRSLSADAIKEFTYLFLITKTVAYTAPDFFILTRVTDKGYYVNGSRAYLYVLAISQALTLILGIVWFIRTKKYVDNVKREGKFFDALNTMKTEESIGNYEIRTKLRSLNFLLVFISVASVFTLEIAFSNWSGINILPHFIYIGLMLIAVFHAKKHISPKTNTPRVLELSYKVAGDLIGVFTFIAALLTYIKQVSFLSVFSYEDIMTDEAAFAAYRTLEILALIEMFLTVAFLLLFMLVMNSFVTSNTGISVTSDRYSRTEKDYHSLLKKKNLIIFIFGAIAAVCKCVYVFLNAKTQIIFTDESDITVGAFSASVVPWFNLVVTATAVFYIILTFYNMSIFKEEVKMKYSPLLHSGTSSSKNYETPSDK